MARSDNPVNPLAAGQRVFERYYLKRTLGVGGMGVVWLAHDRVLEQPIALKFIAQHLVQDKHEIERLKSETRRSLKLSHPNIVRIYDFIQTHQGAAVAMEYVDGWSLWSLRVDNGPNFGVTVADGTDLGSRMTAYRWHVADPIPFTRELKFDIEHAGWTYNNDGTVRSAFEEREDLFSTVAFWYQQGIAQGQPEPAYGSARLPHGNAIQLEVEQRANEAVGFAVAAGRSSAVFGVAAAAEQRADATRNQVPPRKGHGMHRPELTSHVNGEVHCSSLVHGNAHA